MKGVNRYTRIFIRLMSAFAAVVMLIVTATALFGCSFFGNIIGDDYVMFTRTRLALKVDESFDLTDIIDSNVTSYKFTVTGGDVIKLNKNTVTATAVGTCTITVNTDTDSDAISVVVLEKDEDGFYVEVEGSLIQTVGELSAVEFIPIATGSIEKSNVYWYNDGKPVSTTLYDESYEFTPDGAGITVIKAVCGQFSVEYNVRAYYAVEASVSYVGDLEQEYNFTEIAFSVNIARTAANPADYVIWYCDGGVIYEGEQLTLNYIPTPGRHVLSAEVNGRNVFSTDVIARGSIVPDSPTVVYNNVYPHFYVVYNAVGKVNVEITDPNGQVTEYSQNDSRYTERFSEKGFDAKGLVTVCAESSKRKSYSVRVKSLGDGDVITESEYSKSYSFIQLPTAAKSYLETPVLDGDLYVTSVEEYVDIAEYYIYFRKKSGTKIKVSFECYLAFSPNGGVIEMWNDAFPIAATSGSYSDISVTKSGDIVTTSFYVDTVNAPAHDTYMRAGEVKQLHAILPHINYDESKYRDRSYVFPIDLIERTQTVTYSDELFLTVEKHTRPIFTDSGSAARIIYDAARDVLRKICTDDMNDLQKAHAIYDWIMWTVIYDDSASYANSDGESYGAYYLEGVFGDGKTSIGGVKYTPYAVCDGISKAYSLMCNIEGIPCVRVIGKAGDSLRNAGGHAWNKVFVNGAWYAVDCTWGDAHGNIKLDGLNKEEYELGLHDNLFLTDAEISSTHYEPYQSGESIIRYAPATATKKYSVYSDMTYNGMAIDCFITKRQNQVNRVREIAESFAKSYDKRETVYIPRGVNDGVYEINYQGLDIGFEGEITASETDIEAAVYSAVTSVLSNVTVRTYCMCNCVIILIGNR